MLTARHERRALRAAAGAVPASARHLAANAAELRDRSRAVGRERAAVPRPERRDAPHRRAERAHQRRLRGGLQRGQGARLTHSTTRTPDQTDAAIFWQDHAIALWNRIFRTLAASQDLDIVDSARLFAMENLAAADAANRLLERQVLLAVLASDHGDSRGRHRRQPGHPGRPDVAAAVRPSDTGLPPTARHAALPRSPLGARCATSAFVHTLQNFFGTDKIAFSAFSNKSWHDAELRPVLGCAQGGNRRPRVGRHPLPHRRRAGIGARQQGRPLPRLSTTSSRSNKMEHAGGPQMPPELD